MGRLLKIPVLSVADQTLLARNHESDEALFYDRCIRCSVSRCALCIPPGRPKSAPSSTNSSPITGCRAAWWCRGRCTSRWRWPPDGTYGSDHSVDNLVLHRAVILDDTCDPILRTTLNKDDGTLEFASFTATADGD